MCGKRLEFILIVTGIVISQAGAVLAGPQMTSWYNNRTCDSSTSVSISAGETVFFNVSANVSVSSWNWSVDGEAIANNASNLSHTFETFGGYSVSVFAASGNETTQEVEWNITSTLCLTDDLNETVCLSERPERIVSLAPSNTELLFGVGAGDRVVGVTAYCDYPPEAADIYKIGDYSTLSQELIVNALPDLIFSSYGNDMNIINNLKDLNYDVIGLNPLDVDGVLSSIELVGRATQNEVNAGILAADIEERVDSITAITDALSEDGRTRALYVIWYDPIWVAGTGTYINDLLEKAGGKNVAGEGWHVMGLESLLAANPEVIFCSDMGGYSGIREALMGNEIIQYTDAYLNNRIYTIYDPDIIELPGPRVVDGLEELYSFISSNVIYVISSEDPEVNLTAGTVTRVRDQDLPDLILDVVSLEDVNSSFDISNASVPFDQAETFDNSLGKYFKIDASELNLDWAMIRGYYTDAELSGAKLVESSLKMRWYNKSAGTWIALDETMDWVHGTGVSTESERGYSGYVWANVSHFGQYGVSGDKPAPPPAPPSSGGGGGSTARGAVSAATVKSVKAGEVAVFDFDRTLSEVVSEIDLSAKDDAYNVRISVETLKGKPYASMPEPEGVVYNYLKLSPSGIRDSKIDRAELKFRVESSWLRENGIDPTAVKMVRNVDGGWDTLVTLKVGEDGEYAYYTAETPGFSYFAVIAEEGPGHAEEAVPAPEETPAPTTPPPTVAPAPTTISPVNTPAPTTPPPTVAPTSMAAAIVPQPTAAPVVVAKPLSGTAKAIIGSVLLFAVSVARFIFNRRHLY